MEELEEVGGGDGCLGEGVPECCSDEREVIVVVWLGATGEEAENDVGADGVADRVWEVGCVGVGGVVGGVGFECVL